MPFDRGTRPLPRGSLRWAHQNRPKPWFIFALAVIVCAAIILASSNAAQAVDLVGLAQTAALDQPQINVAVEKIVNGVPGAPLSGQTITIDDQGNIGFVQTINITAYLDTGTSGLLLSTGTVNGYTDSSGQSITNSTYNGQPVTFGDIGVGGTANFNVSNPIKLQFAPYTPTTNNLLGGQTDASFTQYYTQQLSSAQIEIGPSDDGSQSLTGDPLLDAALGTGVDVIGMPALTGKVMVVDARSSNTEATTLRNNGGDFSFLLTDPNALDNLSLRTYIYNAGTPFHSGTIETDPGIPTTNLHVKLSYADFSGFTTTTPAGAPGPILAHNPMIGANPLAAPGTDHTPGIQVTFKVPDAANPSKLDTLGASGSFLFDTGAGASFISSKIAAELHVRYVQGSQDPTDPKNTDVTDPQLELYTPDPTHPNDPHYGVSIAPLKYQFQESVSGIGPSVTVAGFYLDSLMIPTIEANPNNPNDPRNIKFSGLRSSDGTQDPTNLGPPVLVQNITATKGTQCVTLDGDLGVNFLVGTVNISGDGFDSSLGGFSPGAFDWLTFDEPNGVLGLKLNSTFHIAGDFDGDGVLTNADIQSMLNALKNISGYETAKGLTDADWMDIADVNRDGVVNMADLLALMQILAGQIPNYGSSSLSPVPEPATATLAGAALIGLLLVRRTRRKR